MLLILCTLGSRFGLSYAAGAVLMAFNFMPLAKVAQHLVYVRSGGVFSLLILFYIRLTLSGVALFFLLVTYNADPVGLLVGLTTVVVNAIIWFITNREQNVSNSDSKGKEA